MVPAPSSAKPRARAGAVRRALPHRLASTRNAAATMATGKLAVWLVKADAADVEIALHCAAAAKHGYIALTASAHIMQEQKILKNLVQDARKAGGLCGSQFEVRAVSWFGLPEGEQELELKLEEWAAAVGTIKAYCTWLVENGGKANWSAKYRGGQLDDFRLLAKPFKEASPQFVDGGWFRFDEPGFTDAVVDFFLKCHGPRLLSNIATYCRELRAKERLEQEGQRSPAEIKRLAAEEAEGLDKLDKAVVRQGGEGPDLRGWKAKKMVRSQQWYFNGPGGESYLSISTAAAAIVNGTASTELNSDKAFTVAQLKAKCEAQGLKVTGTKKVLISRLEDAEKGIFDRPGRRKRPASRAGGGERPAKRVRTGVNPVRKELESLCALARVPYDKDASLHDLEMLVSFQLADIAKATAPMSNETVEFIIDAFSAAERGAAVSVASMATALGISSLLG